MVVGEIADGVDLLVVGGGPGGYTAALRAAELGREVTLVDRSGIVGLGGTCLHVGCIPSKALIEVADVVHRARCMQRAGVSVSDTKVDLGRFQGWKQEIISRLAGGIAGRLEEHGVRVVQGELSFNRPDRAAVATPDGNVTFVEFQSAVVATGSRPTPLAALDVDGEGVVDSSDVLELRQLPSTVAVIGAGYIGVELGTALCKLGAKVTIVERASRILPAAEEAVTRPVQRALPRHGIDLILGAEPVGYDNHQLRLSSRGVERSVTAELLVIAAGRRPNTDSLGLDLAGISLRPDGRVAVDASRRASRRIAAIGDITDGPALAHKAMAEADAAVRALSGKAARFEPLAVPAVVFSDPEVVTVGLTAAAASTAGISAATVQVPLSASGRAHTLGTPAGMVQLVVDRDRDVIVGVHMVGPHVSELAGEATLAIEMSASPRDLADTIHPHPTISEALQTAAAIFAGA